VGVALGMAMTVFGARPRIASGWLASVAHGLVACRSPSPGGGPPSPFLSLYFLLYGGGYERSLVTGMTPASPSQVGVVRFWGTHHMWFLARRRRADIGEQLPSLGRCRQITERHDADGLSVLNDRQPADVVSTHDLHRLRH
jgi:hypothetical protein